MVGLKTILGLYPNIADFEESRIILQKEYDSLIAFGKSEELAHYMQLEETINSEKFKLKHIEIAKLRYKNSDEYNKEKELQKLSKSKDIKLFFNTSVSEILKLYNKIHSSEKLKTYYELIDYIKTNEFLKVKNHYKLSSKKRFQLSDLAHTLNKFKQQSKTEEISGYFKFIGHKLFPNFEQIKDSDKLKQYEELKAIVESHEFISKKDSLSKKEFKTSEESQQLKEYKQLSKSKEIKNYLKIERSHLKKYYEALHNTEELHTYKDLEKFILSNDFIEQKKAIKEKGFNDTDEFKKFSQLEQLKNDSDIKAYFKFLKSKELVNYKLIKDSDKLKRFRELEEYVKTDEFKDEKIYLNLAPKERWEKTEEYSQSEEYKSLKESEKFKWYFANKDHKKFKWFRNWKLTFDDDFDKGKLDKEKWLTRYYWGEKVLNKTYSLQNEKHYISDGNNLEFDSSHLKIITRKEKAEGHIWDTELGIIPKEFDYTSGLINSGKSFRQQYGLFEAKIKFSNAPKLLNAFWMVGDKQTPHIDVAKVNKKCSVGIQTDNSVFKKNLSRAKFSGKYFIYSIEWTAEKITWKINGLELTSTAKNIPQEAMYVALSAGLYDDLNDVNAPEMEIDWIRCYEKVNPN